MYSVSLCFRFLITECMLRNCRLSIFIFQFFISLEKIVSLFWMVKQYMLIFIYTFFFLQNNLQRLVFIVNKWTIKLVPFFSYQQNNIVKNKLIMNFLLNYHFY